MLKIKHKNCIIETDFYPSINFFKYMSDQWDDANVVWKDKILSATSGYLMKNFYKQSLQKPYPKELLELLNLLMNEFLFKTEDYRFSFFKVTKDGEMKPHVDQRSKCSFLIPVTRSISNLNVYDNGYVKSISYKNMVILNTQKLHSVDKTDNDRIIFHIGIHDINFDELSVE